MKYKLCLVSCLLVAGLHAAMAQAGPGTTGADILKINLGARAIALGGAYGAVGGDVQALLFNPATLATVTGSDAVFAHYAALEEVTYEVFGYSQPVADFGHLGGTLVWRHMPTIDNPGAPDLPVAANDAVLTLGVSRGVRELLPELPAALDGLAVGAAGKIIYLMLRETHAVSAALDAGIFWTAPKQFIFPMALSAAVQNFGAPVRFLEESDPLPLTGRLGASLTPLSGEWHRILLAGEWVTSPGNLPKTSVGVEYSLANSVFVRAGYTFESSDNLSGPAAGIGVAFSTGTFRGRVDYTYRPQLWTSWDSVASNHFISLGASF